MRYPPKEVLETWPAPNYVDPVRRGPALMVVLLILVILVTIFVVMRLYARLLITRARIGLDDILIVFSWVFAVGLTGGIILAIQKYGWDLHIWDLPPADNVTSRKVSWACMILYAVSTILSKASILVFYLRILVAKFDILVTKIVLTFVVCYGVAILLVLFLQCQPFGYYWEILVPTARGHCINEGAHVVASATANLLLDIIIFVIPLRTLILLKIRTSQKLQVLGLFSAGLLVIIAASIRLYYVVVVFLDTYDVSWFGYMTWLWAGVEVHISIMCACVPSLRALLVSWNRSFSQNSGSHSNTYGTRGQQTTARSWNHMDEDVRALTRNTQVGHETRIVAGSVRSGTSGAYSSDGEAKNGVRVHMEVMQYQEDFVDKPEDRLGRGRGSMA